MIKELIKLANHLDAKLFTKEADALDSIITKALKKAASLRFVNDFGPTYGDTYGNGPKIYRDQPDGNYVIMPPGSGHPDPNIGSHAKSYDEAKEIATVMWKDYMEKIPAQQKTEIAWRALYSDASEIYSAPSRHGNGSYWKQPRDGESIEMVSDEVAESWLKGASNMDEAVLAWYSGKSREYLESKGSPVEENPIPARTDGTGSSSIEDGDNLFHALVWVAIEHEMFNYLENKPTSDEMDYRDYEERTFGPPPSEEDFESDLPRAEF